MKIKIDPNGFEFSKKNLYDIKRITEDIFCIIDGENKAVVMNVLINLYLNGLIDDNRTKEEFLGILGTAYDKMIDFRNKNE